MYYFFVKSRAVCDYLYISADLLHKFMFIITTFANDILRGDKNQRNKSCKALYQKGKERNFAFVSFNHTM